MRKPVKKLKHGGPILTPLIDWLITSHEKFTITWGPQR
jgi:hypothetical protein